MSNYPQWPPKADRARLPLADDASMQAILAGPAAAANTPLINLFRALGNAPSLAPDFMRYVVHLFQPLELDARLERLVVLLVGRESACEYVWRQNVVTARSLGVSDEEIAAIHDGNLDAPPFTAKHKAAFQFTREAIAQIEVTDATYSAAEKHFSSRALTELLYVIGSYMFFCRLARTGRIPLDETPASLPSELLGGRRTS